MGPDAATTPTSEQRPVLPFIFRARSTWGDDITREMEIAPCTHLRSRPARTSIRGRLWRGDLSFGPAISSPSPSIPPDRQDRAAVAKAAMDSGRTPPIRSRAYGERLQQFVYHSGTLMQPSMRRAQDPAGAQPHRLCGREDERCFARADCGR